MFKKVFRTKQENMTKILYRSWVHGLKNIPAWFLDDQEEVLSETELMKRVLELYSVGFNVMLRHSNSDVMLLIDDKGFGQR